MFLLKLHSELAWHSAMQHNAVQRGTARCFSFTLGASFYRIWREFPCSSQSTDMAMELQAFLESWDQEEKVRTIPQISL